MARSKKIRLATLNVKFVDQAKQSPENYLALWNFIKDNRLLGRTYAKQCVIIGQSYDVFEDNPLKGLYGLLYKYYNLDPNTKWINIKNLEPMGEDESSPVPSEMKPDYKEVGFAFYPKKHKIIIDGGVMSPRSAKLAFENIFQNGELNRNFGDLEIFVVSNSDEVARIIELPSKTYVDIKLTIPNPEDLSRDDQRVYNRFKGQKISAVRLEQKSNHPDGLELGDYEKSLVRLSGANGRTIVKTKEAGEMVTHSTEDSPLIVVGKYNPALQGYMDAVRESSSEMVTPI